MGLEIRPLTRSNIRLVMLDMKAMKATRPETGDQAIYQADDSINGLFGETIIGAADESAD